MHSLFELLKIPTRTILSLELATLPVMILVFQKDKKSIIPISIFSAILGIGVAITGAKFIG
jgi:hypothetical protein